MEVFVIVLCIISIFFAFAAMLLAAYNLHYSSRAVIEIEAYKRSTHQVQMVPAESFMNDAEVNKQINKMDNKHYDNLDDDTEEDIEDESIKK